MIQYQELYKSADEGLITKEIETNLILLHYKVNQLRTLFGKPLTVTRGFSSPEEQRAIYAKKGKPPAMGSQHLIGAAVDLYDPQQELQAWILKNVNYCQYLHLFFEDFSSTPMWVHCQLYPYASYQPWGFIFFEP